MAKVEVSRHLHRFFPVLKEGAVEVSAATAREVVRALDAAVPGIADYVVDERGALRQHVNLFVDGEMVVDRRTLSDPVGRDAKVHILQALSGGQ